MLSGIVRKLSLPILALSLVGWIVYVVGLGFRNASYASESDSTAGAPEYFFFWFCLVIGPFLYVFSVIQSFWESRIPTLIVFLFVPAYMVSVGAILFLDGLLIYTFYQVDESITGANNTLDLNIRCTDIRSNTSLELTDIHDEQKYISIEFAGLLESIAFYWVYLTMIPFFSPEPY